MGSTTRRFTLSVPCGAVASLLGLLGCSATHAEPPPASKAGLEQRSHQPAAAEPKVGRVGLDAHVVWQASAGAGSRPSNGMCARTYNSLRATEIRTDNTWLYLDLVHRSASPEQKHPGETPTIALLVDGCPVRREPLASGNVWRDNETPSTTVVSLADLPDGDLDLALYAFGEEYVVVLNKSGRQVKSIAGKDRKGARIIPANNELGLPTLVAIPEPSCPTGVTL